MGLLDHDCKTHSESCNPGDPCGRPGCVCKSGGHNALGCDAEISALKKRVAALEKLATANATQHTVFSSRLSSLESAIENVGDGGGGGGVGITMGSAGIASFEISGTTHYFQTWQ
mgnify:CR=1 FL=1